MSLLSRKSPTLPRLIAHHGLPLALCHFMHTQVDRQRINYPRYRALGLTVGSDQVEIACKNLVGARCNQAGIRNWTPHGVQGVLLIRAALQTGHFNHLWQKLPKTAA